MAALVAASRKGAMAAACPTPGGAVRGRCAADIAACRGGDVAACHAAAACTCEEAIQAGGCGQDVAHLGRCAAANGAAAEEARAAGGPDAR